MRKCLDYATKAFLLPCVFCLAIRGQFGMGLDRKLHRCNSHRSAGTKIDAVSANTLYVAVFPSLSGEVMNNSQRTLTFVILAAFTLTVLFCALGFDRQSES